MKFAVMKFALGKNSLYILSFELLSFFPVDCVWGQWSTWSSCSKSCGGGTNTRSRSKIETERNGGSCPGSGSDSKRCNTQSCPGKQAMIFIDFQGFTLVLNYLF